MSPDFGPTESKKGPGTADYKNVSKRARKLTGTTLVELLVCVIFLGLCSAAMMNAIGAASRQAAVAEDRLLALATAKSELAKANAAANNNTISTGSTTTYPTDTGMKYPVQVKTDITKVSGSSDLYLVSTQVSWSSTSGSEHTGKIVLQTYVVSNDK